MTTYALRDYVQDLQAITANETDPVRITDLVAPRARKFAKNREWFRRTYRRCDAEQGFGVHLLHEEPNHDLAIFVITWLPDRGTAPHNHGTWAVVVGIEGQEEEINYERVDDGTKPGYADLRAGAAQVMAAGDVARCYPQHIHAVRNVGADISISLHTYGRHINHTGRSEFDIGQKSERPFLVKVAGDE